MRTPTPPHVQMAWWQKAIEDVSLHLTPEAIADQPHPGWFKCRLTRDGVFVPARIWLHQDVDPETGELMDDEVLRCEVDGKPRDPEEAWSYVCRHPIPEHEWRYLTEARRWADENAPDTPYANPRKKVDWLKTPLPTFRK